MTRHSIEKRTIVAAVLVLVAAAASMMATASREPTSTLRVEERPRLLESSLRSASAPQQAGPERTLDLLYANTIVLNDAGAKLNFARRIEFSIGTYEKLGLQVDAVLQSGTCIFYQGAQVQTDNAAIRLQSVDPSGEACTPTSTWVFRVRYWNPLVIAVFYQHPAPAAECLKHERSGGCLVGNAIELARFERQQIPPSREVAWALFRGADGWLVGLGSLGLLTSLLITPLTSRRRWWAIVLAASLVSGAALAFTSLSGAVHHLTFKTSSALQQPRTYYQSASQTVYFEGQRRDLERSEDDWYVGLPRSAVALRLDLHSRDRDTSIDEIRLCTHRVCEAWVGRNLLPNARPHHLVTEIVGSDSALRIRQAEATAFFAIEHISWPTSPASFVFVLLGCWLGVALCWPAALLLYLLVRLTRAMAQRPALTLWSIGLPAGLFLCVLIPPFQNPDEDTHLMRLHQIVIGQFIPTVKPGFIGGEFAWPVPDPVEAFRELRFQPLAKTTASAVWNKLHETPKRSETKLRWIPASNYSPLAYVLQLPGAVVARILDLSPLGLLYAGRLSGLLFYLLACGLAFRYLPSGQPFALSVLLLPMSICLASSVSADSSTTAAALVFFATLASLDVEEQPRKGAVRWFLISAMVLGGAKPLYGFLALAALVLVGRKHQRLALLAIGGSLGITLMWARLTYSQSVTSTNPVAAGQISFLLNEPLAIPGILLDSLWGRAVFYAQSLIGVFGWLDTYLPKLAYTMAVLLLILSYPRQTSRRVAPPRELYVRLVAFGVFGLSMLAMFVANSALGETTAVGFQGRYLLPLMFFLLPMTPVNAVNERPVWMITICYLAIYPAVVWTVLTRFYG